MQYKYVGELPDYVSVDEATDYYLNPHQNVEISDDAIALPYFSRMVQNGLLKAVSQATAPKVEQPEEVPEAPTPTPAPEAANTAEVK